MFFKIPLSGCFYHLYKSRDSWNNVMKHCFNVRDNVQQCFFNQLFLLGSFRFHEYQNNSSNFKKSFFSTIFAHFSNIDFLKTTSYYRSQRQKFLTHFWQKVWPLRNIADNMQTQKSFVSWVTVRAFSVQSPV